MLSRSLLARLTPLRLSTALTTRVCLRSLGNLHIAPAPRAAPPSCASLRQFSAAPSFRTESPESTRTHHTPSGTCYIANLPYKVTAEQLKDAFSTFGKIESVKLLTSDAGRSRGVGFIHFESVADAVNFVEAHVADPIFVLDRQLFVEHAQKTKNIPRPAEPTDTLMMLRFQGESEAGVRAMFGNYAEDIQAVRFDRKEAGQRIRRAFIQFWNVEMATKAMDAFRDLNENTEITYARQRQTSANTYSLASRLSQHRDH